MRFRLVPKSMTLSNSDA